MKRTIQLAALLILTLSLQTQIRAADPHPADLDLKELVTRINAKLQQGPQTAETLATELADFDSLIAKYPDEPEQVAQIAFMRATLYTQVIKDQETGKKLLAEIETTYPGTPAAKQAASILYRMSPEGIASAQAEEEARLQKLANLVGSPAPEIDFEWSTRSGLAKLSDLKGQVVVLDFWATWCSPCIRSFPQMREHVAHFQGSPVTFLGVTSLQGRVSNISTGKANTRGNPDLEHQLTKQFIAERKMNWDVVFSTQNVFNPDYDVKGIPSVAIIAPDGTVRHYGIFPGDPSSQIAKKVEAILKEFNLPLPPSSN